MNLQPRERAPQGSLNEGGNLRKLRGLPPEWSIDGLLLDWKPHESWKQWFAQAYDRVVAGDSADERLNGWSTIACIYGDMHACQACLLVCLYAQSL